MDIRYKIIACVLSITLVFSSAFSRPVYANPVVIGAAGLALTLMAAAGVTFVGMSAADIDAAVDDFLASNPVSKTFLEQLVKEAPVVSGSLQITGALLDQYGDDILSFFQSVFDWFSDGGGGVVVPSDNPFSFLPESLSLEYFGSVPTIAECPDSTYPFVLFTISYPAWDVLNCGFVYVALDSDGGLNTWQRSIRIFLDSTGSVVKDYRVTDYSFGYVDSYSLEDPPAYFEVSNGYLFECQYFDDGYHRNKWLGYDGFFLLDGLTFSGGSFDTDDVVDLVKYYNVCHDIIVENIPADIYVGDVDAVNPSIAYPEGVTADDVITGWHDTISDNRDVILYPLTGEDMVGVNGFDKAYGADGVAGGAVVGVEVPVGAVDVPAGDVTGWLDKIYTKVSALPAAIGAAVIGTGSLNFDKFDNVSLVSVFPFCIPWDLVNCIRYFDVAEAVPVWTIDLSGSPLAAFGTFTIDFSRFSSWAKIVKFFLYSFFVVGLVKITRLLIKG